MQTHTSYNFDLAASQKIPKNRSASVTITLGTNSIHQRAGLAHTTVLMNILISRLIQGKSKGIIAQFSYFTDRAEHKLHLQLHPTVSVRGDFVEAIKTRFLPLLERILQSEKLELIVENVQEDILNIIDS